MPRQPIRAPYWQCTCAGQTRRADSLLIGAQDRREGNAPATAASSQENTSLCLSGQVLQSPGMRSMLAGPQHPCKASIHSLRDAYCPRSGNSSSWVCRALHPPSSPSPPAAPSQPLLQPLQHLPLKCCGSLMVHPRPSTECALSLGHLRHPASGTPICVSSPLWAADPIHPSAAGSALDLALAMTGGTSSERLGNHGPTDAHSQRPQRFLPSQSLTSTPKSRPEREA